MTRTALKRQIRQELASNKWGRVLVLLSAIPLAKAAGLLISILPTHDLTMRHRAAVLLGRMVAKNEKTETEICREVLRRLVWSLNEESGGIGWGSAEAMGEIAASAPIMASEFGKFLVSYLASQANYLEFEPLQRSVAWALGRWAWADQRSETLSQATQPLLALLEHRDPALRLVAAWALGGIRADLARSSLEGILTDGARSEIWLDGELKNLTVGEMAALALENLKPTKPTDA